MVAHTPKWGLAVEETGDPADMPAASGRSAASIEQALDRIVAQYTSAFAGAVNRAGDTMTGELVVPNLRVSPNWQVNVSGGRFGIYRMSPNGTAIESLPLFIEYPTGNVYVDAPMVQLSADVHLPKLVASSGGADLAGAATRAVIQLAGGQIVTFDRLQLALWSAAQPSTRRIKENIRPAAPSGVLDVEPATYQYRQDVIEDGGITHLGVIAEQVAEVFPAGAVRGEDGQPEGVNVMALVAGLIHEVRELRDRVAALEAGGV